MDNVRSWSRNRAAHDRRLRVNPSEPSLPMSEQPRSRRRRHPRSQSPRTGRYPRPIDAAKIFAGYDVAIALASVREGTARARVLPALPMLASALAVPRPPSRNRALSRALAVPRPPSRNRAIPRARRHAADTTATPSYPRPRNARDWRDSSPQSATAVAPLPHLLDAPGHGIASCRRHNAACT
ncbi:hypothetical protein EV714DRAFT_278142 [Schizophyllum commune]